MPWHLRVFGVLASPVNVASICFLIFNGLLDILVYSFFSSYIPLSFWRREKNVYMCGRWYIPARCRVVKNIPASTGDLGSASGSGRFPSRRKWHPALIFLPGKSHENPWTEEPSGLQTMGSQESNTS